MILIQRADGSLQNTLEQLRKVLPIEEDASLWQGIATSDGIRFEGRAKLFHDALGHSLGANFPRRRRRRTWEWCVEGNFPSTASPEVREGWKAPSRILEIVSGNKGARGIPNWLNSWLRYSRPATTGPEHRKTEVSAHPLSDGLSKEMDAIVDPNNAGKPTSDVAPETFRFLRA